MYLAIFHCYIFDRISKKKRSKFEVKSIKKSPKVSGTGQGDYAAAVDWLERADTIPLAPSDYREGIKVTQGFIY